MCVSTCMVILPPNVLVPYLCSCRTFISQKQEKRLIISLQSLPVLLFSHLSWELETHLSPTLVSVAGTTWLITSLIKTLAEWDRVWSSPCSTQSYSKQPQTQNKAKTLIPLMQCWLAAPRLLRNSQTCQLCSSATFCTFHCECFTKSWIFQAF